MSSASYPTVTASKKGIQLDPRTKLLLLLTITTLMFSTSNEGIMNIVKPCLSLVPFVLILSFQNGRKVFAIICGLFCVRTDSPYNIERPAFFYCACDYIYHDTVCTWHHDGSLFDFIDFGQ